MASALEPLVSGCIFRLVVVSVAHGFGTFSAATRHHIPVSSSGSQTEEIFLHGRLFSGLPSQTRTGPALAFWGNRGEGEGSEGYGRRDDYRGGGRMGGVQRESRGLASPLQHWALSPTAGCGPTWVVKGGSLYGGSDRWYRRV